MTLGSKLLSQFVEDLSNARPLKPRSKSAFFLQLSLRRSPKLARCLALDACRDLNCVRSFLALDSSGSRTRSSPRTQFCTSIRESARESSWKRIGARHSGHASSGVTISRWRSGIIQRDPSRSLDCTHITNSPCVSENPLSVPA